ncbi:MAG: hypothetical protein AABM31_03995 [Actinomycetota bacterium]
MTDSPLQPVAKAALIALMAVGSIVLWLGVPIGWLWIGSQVQSGNQSTGFGPYMLVLAGIIVSVVVLAKCLASLNRAYGRVAGEEPSMRVRLPWHRSMRGDDDSRYQRNVLDVVMVISVSLAVVAMTIWFFFFAGSPLPST